MTEDDIVATVGKHMAAQFPRKCPNCGRTYATVQDYLRITTPVGQVISDDVTEGNWRPTKPLGALAFSNCPCGDTLAMSTNGLPLATTWAIMDWLRRTIAERGVEPQAVVEELRTRIRAELLAN